MIYLDNAATTAMDQETVRAMYTYYTNNFANPGSLYKLANDSRKAIETAKSQIAELIGARPHEIYFTSGGTESNNLALMGTMLAMKERPHIITAATEHESVINTCKMLEKMGCELTILGVRSDGLLGRETVERAFKENTRMLSIMLVNNEIGVISPIEKFAKIAHEKGALLHVDAAAAVGIIPVDVKALDCDLMTGSAHKFGGPKGVGFLYVRDGVKIRKMMNGGSQQNGLRAGTENVPGIVGMGAAAELAGRDLEFRCRHIESLRNMLLNELRNRIPGISVNGSTSERVPCNINVSFQGVEGWKLVQALDEQGICISTGAMSALGEKGPSHVVRALGFGEDRAKCAVRITLDHNNNMEQIERVAGIIEEQVARIRGFQY